MKPERTPGAQRVGLLLLGLAVAGIVVGVHWPVLSAASISFDDQEAFIENPLIQNPSWHSVGQFFGEVFLSSVVRGYYRPMTLTSLMLDWAMGGRPGDLTAFHRTSLALHVGSTLLVMLLCYQVFRLPWVAAMVGLLFGVHPLTVEPIAWVMERKTLLAAFFTFAAINAYVRYASVGRRGWYGGAIVCFLLALLSKPTSTPLPILLILIDVWPLKRMSRRALVEKIPFVLLSVAFAVITVLCEQRVNRLTIPAAAAPFDLPLRLCYLIVFYPLKILLPIHLSSVYLLPRPLALTNPVVFASVVGAVGLVASIVIFSRRIPALWVGSAMFFVGLAPTMGFVHYSWVFASDKYVYLPSIGLMLMLGALLSRLWTGGDASNRSKRRGSMITVVALAAGLLSWGTRSYLWQWQRTDRLLDYMLTLAPDSLDLHTFRCGYFASSADFAKGVRECDEAIRLNPDDSRSYYHRANLYLHKGDYLRAISDYTESIARNPRFGSAYANRSIAYQWLGQYDSALKDLDKVIDLAPDDPIGYYNRAEFHWSRGTCEPAVTDYTQAIKLQPDNPSAYNGRGNANFVLGRVDEAIRDYTRAIELRPGYAFAYHNRGLARSSQGRIEQAIGDFTQAIRDKPDYVLAYVDRGKAYLAVGEVERAIADVSAAIALQPDAADLYCLRAEAYQRMNDDERSRADEEQCKALGGHPTTDPAEQGEAVSSPAA